MEPNRCHHCSLLGVIVFFTYPFLRELGGGRKTLEASFVEERFPAGEIRSRKRFAFPDGCGKACLSGRSPFLMI